MINTRLFIKKRLKMRNARVKWNLRAYTMLVNAFIHSRRGNSIAPTPYQDCDMSCSGHRDRPRSGLSRRMIKDYSRRAMADFGIYYDAQAYYGE